MRRVSISFGCLAACSLLVLAGCGDSKSEEGKTKTKPPVKTHDEEKTKTVEEPAAKIPPVELSGQEATCVVKLDDAFPDAKLKDMTGAEQSLSQLRGQRATVVLL